MPIYHLIHCMNLAPSLDASCMARGMPNIIAEQDCLVNQCKLDFMQYIIGLAHSELQLLFNRIIGIQGLTFINTEVWRQGDLCFMRLLCSEGVEQIFIIQIRFTLWYIWQYFIIIDLSKECPHFSEKSQNLAGQLISSLSQSKLLELSPPWSQLYHVSFEWYLGLLYF